MLTIERFNRLVGRTFVFPNVCGWTITEAGEYISPVRHDCLYIMKLKSHTNKKEVRFSIYRSINIKDKGYRLYNSINGSYIVLKLESFKDMRTFTGILTKELEDINQFI
jgi:hypothetical protein